MNFNSRSGPVVASDAFLPADTLTDFSCGSCGHGLPDLHPSVDFDPLILACAIGPAHLDVNGLRLLAQPEVQREVVLIALS